VTPYAIAHLDEIDEIDELDDGRSPYRRSGTTSASRPSASPRGRGGRREI
jgi:hypothetical protein